VIRIKNGLVVPYTSTDLFIDEGVVVSIKKSLTRRRGEEVLDATGCLVVPGVVDIGARLVTSGAFGRDRALGNELKGALLSGVTTIFSSTEEVALPTLPRVSAIKGVTFGSEARGIEVVRAAIECSARGKVLYVVPSVTRFCPSGVMHESPLSFEMGLEGIPAAAEEAAIAELLEIARSYRVRMHIAKISTARSVELVRRAKAEGITVTAGVSVHHLLLTEDAVRGFDASAKLYPPLRSEEDRVALIGGVRDGAIDCVVSDHHPKGEEEMNIEFARTPFGSIGLQVMLPGILGLNDIATERAIDAVTAAPARCMGAEVQSIAVGAAADIVVFDPNSEWTLDRDTNLSGWRNSPHWGAKFKGRVRHVVLGGRLVVQDGKFVEEQLLPQEEIKKVSN